MKKPSTLEKISGNLVTEAGLTAVAAFAATPLAALLPVLSTSLAAGRHTNRVKDALNEVNSILEEHAVLIHNLSDSQYKIINESILTILQTTQQRKIEYLKKSIKNNIKEEKVPLPFSTQIARILRDISAEELSFLLEHSKYFRLVFDQEPMTDQEIKIETQSEQGLLVSGLISMGLIISGSSTYDDLGRYQFSPIVDKLLAVVG